MRRLLANFDGESLTAFGKVVDTKILANAVLRSISLSVFIDNPLWAGRGQASKFLNQVGWQVCCVAVCFALTRQTLTTRQPNFEPATQPAHRLFETRHTGAPAYEGTNFGCLLGLGCMTMNQLDVLLERELCLDELTLDDVIKILTAIEGLSGMDDYEAGIRDWILNEQHPDLVGVGNGFLRFGSKSWQEFTDALMFYAEMNNDCDLWFRFFRLVTKQIKIRPLVFDEFGTDFIVGN